MTTTQEEGKQRQADLWSEGGVFAQSFPDYRYRWEQREMYQTVTRALLDETHALVEAGTGTGKGLAYLTPLILMAYHKPGVKVGVSASTINLQEQLVNKDVPEAVRALAKAGLIDEKEFRYTTLKGKGNYLCEENREALEEDAGDWAAAQNVLRKVSEWQTETGDRAELTLTQEEGLPWRLISCQYSRGCMAYQAGATTCSVTRARRAANDAHLVIVNHALLLSDIAGNDPHLGQVTHWVLDEGHHIEEEASRQFGAEMSEGDLAKLLGETEKDPVMGYQAAEAGKAWSQLWAALTLWLQEHSKYTVEAVTIKPATRESEEWRACEKRAEAFIGRAQDLENSCLHQMQIARTLGDAKREATVRKLHDTTNEIRLIVAAVTNEHDPTWVTWVEPRDGAANLVRRIPLEVGPILREKLFGRRKSVIVTSATLTSGGRDFSHFAERIGAENARTRVLESPFNYREQARLLIPSDMPNPRRRDAYEEATARAITDITTELDGHTLALFTSNAAIKWTKEEIERGLARRGIETLAQNVDGSATDLLRRYRANPRAVILGTNSFWEGVDLAEPGLLQAVVICKLPFPVPSDPVIEARSDLYHDPFMDYLVPMAVMKFRQGFGRLIRNDESLGTVVVLDPRFDHRKYGHAFQRSIPVCDEPSSTRHDVGELAKAWQESRGPR